MIVVSVMVHPDDEPKIQLNLPEYCEVVINKRRGYANAVIESIHHAHAMKSGLVVCDGDGYHSSMTIKDVCEWTSALPHKSMIVKPYRLNIGFQSQIFSWLFNERFSIPIKDVTGGLYGLSEAAVRSMSLFDIVSEDFTINVEIILRLFNSTVCGILQFPYMAGKNNLNSHRPSFYQLKLLWKLF